MADATHQGHGEHDVDAAVTQLIETIDRVLWTLPDVHLVNAIHRLAHHLQQHLQRSQKQKSPAAAATDEGRESNHEQGADGSGDGNVNDPPAHDRAQSSSHKSNQNEDDERIVNKRENHSKKSKAKSKAKINPNAAFRAPGTKKKHGGDRSQIEPANDKEMQTAIERVGSLTGELIHPSAEQDPQDILRVAAAAIQHAGASAQQMSAVLEVISQLMSRNAVVRLRDIIIQGRVDTREKTHVPGQPRRFRDTPGLEELQDFMAASNDAAALSKLSSMSWFAEMAAFARMAEAYNVLRDRLHRDPEAAQQVTDLALPFRQRIAKGKNAQYHSPENDAITLTVLRNCPEGDEGTDIFSKIRTSLKNRIRQGNNLLRLAGQIGNGTWAMLAGWKWKTILSIANPNYMAVALGSITAHDGNFSGVYARLGLHYIDRYLVTEVGELDFDFISRDNAELTGGGGITLSTLLGVRQSVVSLKDVVMTDDVAWFAPEEQKLPIATLLAAEAGYLQIENNQASDSGDQNGNKDDDNDGVSERLRRAMHDSDDDVFGSDDKRTEKPHAKHGNRHKPQVENARRCEEDERERVKSALHDSDDDPPDSPLTSEDELLAKIHAKYGQETHIDFRDGGES